MLFPKKNEAFCAGVKSQSYRFCNEYRKDVVKHEYFIGIYRQKVKLNLKELNLFYGKKSVEGEIGLIERVESSVGNAVVFGGNIMWGRLNWNGLAAGSGKRVGWIE